MKLKATNQKIVISGYNKVQVRIIWIIFLYCSFLIIPFLYFSINNTYNIFIFIGFLMLVFFLEFSFQFRIVIQKEDISVEKSFLNFSYFNFNSSFNKVVINKKFILFESPNSQVLIESENGLENETIHIERSGSFEILEIGGRNDGQKLLTFLNSELSHISVNLDNSSK